MPDHPAPAPCPEAEATTEAIWREIHNERRAARRKWLYHNDPIYRLTKLKDCKERRQRAARKEA